jgi:hypothetical protein
MDIDFAFLIKNFNKLSCLEKTKIKSNINIDWKNILPNLQLKEELIELFADELNWNDVLRYQIRNLSPECLQRNNFRLK